MGTITLRPATPDDYDFAYRVHCAAMRPSVARTYGWDADWQAHYFWRHFDPAKREIIRYNGGDVGVLSVEEREKSLFLGLIAIFPLYQRRGIGTTLMQRLQQDATRRGPTITLQVLKTNRARALYERLGFVLVGETETHHKMSGQTGSVIPSDPPATMQDRPLARPLAAHCERVHSCDADARRETQSASESFSLHLRVCSVHLCGAYSIGHDQPETTRKKP